MSNPEGLGLKPLEVLFKNKSVYTNSFEKRIVSHVYSQLRSNWKSKYPSDGLGLSWVAAGAEPRAFLVKHLSPPLAPGVSFPVVQAPRMISRKVVASLLLVSLLSLLAEQTQGFMPFFTQSDFQKMQVTLLE